MEISKMDSYWGYFLAVHFQYLSAIKVILSIEISRKDSYCGNFFTLHHRNLFNRNQKTNSTEDISSLSIEEISQTPTRIRKKNFHWGNFLGVLLKIFCCPSRKQLLRKFPQCQWTIAEVDKKRFSTITEEISGKVFQWGIFLNTNTKKDFLWGNILAVHQENLLNRNQIKKFSTEEISSLFLREIFSIETRKKDFHW